MVKMTNWKKAFWAVVTGDDSVKKKILADRAAKRKKTAVKRKKTPVKAKKNAGKRKAPARDLFDLL